MSLINLITQKYLYSRRREEKKSVFLSSVLIFLGKKSVFQRHILVQCFLSPALYIILLSQYQAYSKCTVLIVLISQRRTFRIMDLIQHFLLLVAEIHIESKESIMDYSSNSVKESEL